MANLIYHYHLPPILTFVKNRVLTLLIIYLAMCTIIYFSQNKLNMFEWDDKYSVGISIIDKEHKKFIDIINKAIVAKEHNGNPGEVKKLLKGMANYTLTHFATEETYMIKFNYPGYKYHKEEHHDFTMTTIANLRKLNSLLGEFKKESGDVVIGKMIPEFAY